MERKGLCSTCVQADSCIYTKNTRTVWQCEEFSSGDLCATAKKAKVARSTAQEVALESE